MRLRHFSRFSHSPSPFPPPVSRILPPHSPETAGIYPRLARALKPHQKLLALLHSLNILLHVSAGIIAMVMGIIAYSSVKGGKAHRQYGRLFLAFISVVVLTALTGVIVFVDRPFLTIVTLQSAYMAYTGFRVVKLKSLPFRWPDLLVMAITTVFLVLFFVRMQDATILWNRKVVLYLLFYLCLILVFDLLRVFIPRLITSPRFWLYDHIFRITSAFTALVSAGTGTVLGGFEPWNQIIPAILGTFWLVFCLLYFPKRQVNSRQNSSAS